MFWDLFGSIYIGSLSGRDLSGKLSEGDHTWRMGTTLGHLYAGLLLMCSHARSYVKPLHVQPKYCKRLGNTAYDNEQLTNNMTLFYSLLLSLAHPPCRMLHRCWPWVPAGFRGVGVEVWV